MRHLLLTLPFMLLPLSTQAQEHPHHDRGQEHAHGSLAAHAHGIASLNVALEGAALEIELHSPAMNLVGFEHAAASEAERAQVRETRARLQQPQALFGLPDAAGCRLEDTALDSPIFDTGHETHEHGPEGEHSDIETTYRLACSRPEALQGLDLGGFFQAFPATRTLHVQVIGPNGQTGAELDADSPRLDF